VWPLRGSPYLCTWKVDTEWHSRARCPSTSMGQGAHLYTVSQKYFSTTFDRQRLPPSRYDAVRSSRLQRIALQPLLISQDSRTVYTIASQRHRFLVNMHNRCRLYSGPTFFWPVRLKTAFRRQWPMPPPDCETRCFLPEGTAGEPMAAASRPGCTDPL
jgi:hypothetical protein